MLKTKALVAVASVFVVITIAMIWNYAQVNPTRTNASNVNTSSSVANNNQSTNAQKEQNTKPNPINIYKSLTKNSETNDVIKEWAKQYPEASELIKNSIGSTLYYGGKIYPTKYNKYPSVKSEDFEQRIQEDLKDIKDWKMKHPGAAKTLSAICNMPVEDIFLYSVVAEMKAKEELMQQRARMLSNIKHLEGQMRIYDHYLNHPVYDSRTHWVDKENNVHPK